MIYPPIEMGRTPYLAYAAKLRESQLLRGGTVNVAFNGSLKKIKSAETHEQDGEPSHDNPPGKNLICGCRRYESGRDCADEYESYCDAAAQIPSTSFHHSIVLGPHSVK